MKMRFSSILLLTMCATAFLTLWACSSGDDSDDDVDRTVYTAGEYDVAGLSQPCYWIGTKMAPLVLPSGYDGGTVSTIQVVDGTIHNAGYLHFSTPEPGNVSCYWKDTTPTVLQVPAGSEEARAESLFVSDGVPYMAGFYEVGSSGVAVPCYWKGSERIDLSVTAGNSGSAIGIYVADGKVYVAGRDGKQPCYWIDGVRTNFTESSVDGGRAHSIIPVGGALYVGGSYQYSADLNGDIACFWKDGVKTELTIPTHGDDDGGYKTVVVNGTVYTSGTYGVKSVPCYWIETARTDIPVPSTEFGGFSTNIFVSDGVVYSTGGYLPTAMTTHASYWTGTTRTDLAIPAGCTQSAAYCIYVQ